MNIRTKAFLTLKPQYVILFAMCCLLFPNIIFAKHHAHRFHKARHSIDFMKEKNMLQIESYLNFEANNGQLTTAHPSVLIRYGIIDILEIRLNMDCSTVQDLNSYTSKTGFSPIQPGFKIRINKPKLFVPSFAFTGSVTIPKAASKDFAQTYWAPSLLLSAEQDFDKNGKYSVEYGGGLFWDADNFQRIYTATLNAEFDVTPSTTFYADFYFFKPQNDIVDLRADIGANYDITPHIQFDVSAGAGFTSSAPEFFVNAGFVFSYYNWSKRIKKPATGYYTARH